MTYPPGSDHFFNAYPSLSKEPSALGGSSLIMRTFEIPAKNCGRRRKLEDVTGVILHSTDSSTASSAVAWFKNPRAKVSAHIVVDTDGTIYKALRLGHCLDVTMYHAGKSRGWGGSGCNSYTVGIEQAHVDSDKVKHSWPEEQINQVVWYINEIKKVCPNLHYISRHRDIAPGRKVDPDEFYPMEEVARRTGLTWWKP